MNSNDTPKLNLPFTRSWWIEEGTVIGGRFPGTLDADETNKMLETLVKMDVGLIVNLQEPTETGAIGIPFPDYKPQIREFAAAHKKDIEMINIPIPDMGVTHKEDVKKALDAIDKTLAKGRKVYVHCWGGHGRTGTIAGCLMRRRGMDADEVFELFKQRRAHDSHLVNFTAPQTDAQREMVRNWSEE